MKTYRHGDWSFVPFNGKIDGKKIEHNRADFTFGEGEATNHFHTLHAPTKDDMQFYRQEDGSWIVELKTEAYLTHPEHSMKVDMKVPAGTYRVFQRREKDWFSLSVRRVID